MPTSLPGLHTPPPCLLITIFHPFLAGTCGTPSKLLQAFHLCTLHHQCTILPKFTHLSHSSLELFLKRGTLESHQELSTTRLNLQKNLIVSSKFDLQVSPGVRANNYYDNFRSYSRQNRLSGGAPVNLRGEGEPANNLPSSRPRRKYKINREQNRLKTLIRL